MARHKLKNSVFDIEELSNRLSNDNDFIYDLLNDYVQDLQQRLSQIELLILEENLEEIQAIVHALKGSTSYLSMHYIWQAVCLLENALKRKDFKMIDIYFEVLSNEHEQLVKYLETLPVH